MKNILLIILLSIVHINLSAQNLQLTASAGMHAALANGESIAFTIGEPIVFYQDNLSITQGFQQPRKQYCDELAAFDIFPNDTMVCNASNYSIAIGIQYTFYEWSKTVPANTGRSYTPKSTGRFGVTVEDQYGCIGKDSTDLVYLAQNIAVVKSDKTLLCSADTAVLSSPYPFENYVWNTGATTNTITVINADTSKKIFSSWYKLEANIGQCRFQDSVKIYFQNKLINSLGDDSHICDGDSVVIDAGDVFYAYYWHSTVNDENVPNRTAQKLVAKTSATYYVDLSSHCGFYTLYKTILVDPLPQYLPSQPLLLCEGDVLQINNMDTIADNNVYKWSSENDIENYTTSTHHLETMAAGAYHVDITTPFGCKNITALSIVADRDCTKIPNLFTPNKDNFNENFVLKGFKPGVCVLEVMNRYGQRVYFSESYRNNWNGDGLSDGVYYYSIKNKKTADKYNGWVQIANKLE